MENSRFLLQAKNLVVGYKPGSKNPVQVAGPLNTEMLTGELICLLGPNGAGKSTLLRTLSGLQTPLSGNIELNGEQLQQLSPPQIAKKLSLVLTDSVKSGNLDVYSLISLGRYPYSGWLGTLNSQDRNIIDWAIASTQVEPLIGRTVSQLSDGECQKVMLARALAQNTPLIILDEPTAHLDLPSRIELMRLLHQLATDTQKGILISTHELDLALQVADKIWLLKKDGSLDTGSPETLVLNGAFEAAFDKAGIAFDKLTGTFNIRQNQGPEIVLNGSGAAAFWTRRALLRKGFLVSSNNSSELSVEVITDSHLPKWILVKGSERSEWNNLEDLISALTRF